MTNTLQRQLLLLPMQRFIKCLEVEKLPQVYAWTSKSCLVLRKGKSYTLLKKIRTIRSSKLLIKIYYSSVYIAFADLKPWANLNRTIECVISLRFDGTCTPVLFRHKHTLFQHRVRNLFWFSDFRAFPREIAVKVTVKVNTCVLRLT